jgi:integrase
VEGASRSDLGIQARCDCAIPHGTDGRSRKPSKDRRAQPRPKCGGCWKRRELAPVQDPGRRTVGDLLDEWLPHLEARGRSPRTLAENRREIETRIRPDLGPIRLDQLTPKDLDDAYQKWGKELSPSSVHRHGAVLAAALSQAVKWGWLAVSPALQATLPPQRAAQSLTIPDVDQIGQLIKGATDNTMKAAVALAFVTGARRGELCALRWSDIDLDAGVVRVARSLVEDSKGELVEKSTKTGRSRFVTLDARAVTLLKRHQASQEVRAGGTLSASAFVLSDDPSVRSAHQAKQAD